MANGRPGYKSAYGWQALGRGLHSIGEMASETLEERRRRELEERDERLRRQGVQAEELAQPGASTLSSFMANPENYGPGETAAGGPVTEESLRRIGRAEETEVPIEFRAPPPETYTAGKATATVQDRAPYLTAAGTVMNPRAARRQALDVDRIATLAREQTVRDIGEQAPWERAGLSEDDYYKHLRRQTLATEPPGRDRLAAPTVGQAMDIVRSRYAVYAKDKNGNVRYDAQGQPVWAGRYSKSDEEMYAEALELAQGKAMRPTPAPPNTRQSGEGFQWLMGREAMAALEPGKAMAVPSASAAASPPSAGAQVAPGIPLQATPMPDVKNKAAAQARAQQLKAEGKTRAQILQIMTQEGFPVTP